MPGENCSVFGCGSRRRTKGMGICSKLTYLSTASVHEALDIHAHCACTLIKNSKLRFMVEQTSHLIQCSKNNTNQPYNSSNNRKIKPSPLSPAKVLRRSDTVQVGLREQQNRTY